MNVATLPVWSAPNQAPEAAPQPPAAPAQEAAPQDSTTVSTPAPAAPSLGEERGALGRMWDGAKVGAGEGWTAGKENGRKWAKQGLALGLGLAAAGTCLFYAGSLWRESPIMTLIFTIPITIATFKFGETVGKMVGHVVGPVVGAPTGAILGAVKGAWNGLRGNEPPQPEPPPTQP
jgi:hypothetical protein